MTTSNGILDNQAISALSKKTRLVERLLMASRAAKNNNVRTRGVMPSPPTVTDNGTTAPAGQTNGYLLSVAANLASVKYDGTWDATQNVFKSSRIGPTGGNVGNNDGTFASSSRCRFLVEDVKVTFRLSGSARAYRFIVDGRYVDLSGLVPGATSGTRYYTLDFTSAGGRAIREITVETQLNQAVVGVYLSPTGKLHEASDPLIKSVALGDSWIVGTAATHLADAIDRVTADYLGWDCHMQSGASSTGWANPSTGYNFLQRVQNGDPAYNGAEIDVLWIRASLNDRNFSGAAITANSLAGMQKLRADYPNALILIEGAFPVAGAGGGTTSAVQNEAAVKAAFGAWNDAFSIFVPITGALPAAPISGTGTPTTPTGSGNSDFLMANGDTSHLSTVGSDVLGKWQAAQIESGLQDLWYRLAA